MSYKLFVTGAIAGVAMLSSPALAQDGSATTDTSWTGPYIGGSLGYSWQPNNSRETNETLVFDTDGDGNLNNSVTSGGSNFFSPGFCRGVPVGTPAAGGCRGDNDGKAGWSVHAGYDMQMGQFLVGAVVEGGRKVVSNTVTGYTTAPDVYALTRKLDWDAAARVRAGYILPTNTLLYATGGLAYGRFENSLATSNGYNSFTEHRRRDNDWGWTLGGGIEQKISDRFSIGVLYKYTRFTPNDYRVTVGAGTPPSATDPFVATPAGQTVIGRSNSQFNVQDVRATASFHF